MEVGPKQNAQTIKDKINFRYSQNEKQKRSLLDNSNPDLKYHNKQMYKATYKKKQSVFLKKKFDMLKKITKCNKNKQIKSSGNKKSLLSIIGRKESKEEKSAKQKKSSHKESSKYIGV